MRALLDATRRIESSLRLDFSRDAEPEDTERVGDAVRSRAFLGREAVRRLAAGAARRRAARHPATAADMGSEARATAD